MPTDSLAVRYPTLITASSLINWRYMAAAIVMSEYYLATGDEYVLPAIREYGTKLAMGQSGAGTWGHSMAMPAVNGGKLVMPPVDVAAGSSTVNVGEDAGDAAIDLVNSASASSLPGWTACSCAPPGPGSGDVPEGCRQHGDS